MFIFTLVLVLVSVFGEALLQNFEFEETERIVGGKPAEEGKYPWTVALYYETTFICTASIISETAILTAAHCVVFQEMQLSPQNLHGIAGAVNRSSSDGVYIEFKNVTVNPWYNVMENDVAILETTAPIDFTPKVQKICIANEKIGSLVLKRVVAMGWGQTNRDTNKPSMPDILQFTNQRIVSNLKCLILFFGRPVPSSVVCASGLGSGICVGDSGGPLVYYVGRQPIQVGIASFIGILGCGRLLGPGGFTRISSYTEFIKKEATGDVCVL